jgi:hypothetical protein
MLTMVTSGERQAQRKTKDNIFLAPVADIRVARLGVLRIARESPSLGT